MHGLYLPRPLVLNRLLAFIFVLILHPIGATCVCGCLASARLENGAKVPLWSHGAGAWGTFPPCRAVVGTHLDDSSRVVHSQVRSIERRGSKESEVGLRAAGRLIEWWRSTRGDSTDDARHHDRIRSFRPQGALSLDGPCRSPVRGSIPPPTMTWTTEASSFSGRRRRRANNRCKGALHQRVLAGGSCNLVRASDPFRRARGRS